MVRTRRENYKKLRLDGTNGEKLTAMAMETTKESGMAGMAAPVTTAISTKALQEILAESQKYVSPPRPMTTAPRGIMYLQTPVTTQRHGGLP